jgi:hypothetical protein
VRYAWCVHAYKQRDRDAMSIQKALGFVEAASPADAATRALRVSRELVDSMLVSDGWEGHDCVVLEDDHADPGIKG